MSSIRRPRVLVVTRNLPPLIGGMERLIYETINALSTEWEVAVVGPSGCESSLPAVTRVNAVPPKPLWKFLSCALGMSIGSVVRFNPDLILSGSGLTVPVSLAAAKIRRVPVVTWLHGLDIVAANLIYQSLFVRSFHHCRLVLANSQHTASLAARAGLNLASVRILHPGVSIPGPDQSGCFDFRSKYGLGNRVVLLSVGRLTRRKGLVEFIEFCMPDLVRIFPDIVLVVVGDDATAAASGSGKSIRAHSQAVAERVAVQDKVLFVGAVSDFELAGAYVSSTLNIFPALDVPGDVEGFGMVTVEAAAYGLPTVAFRVGGIPDAVGEGVSGWLIQSGDYKAMTEQIVRAIQQHDTLDVSAESCRNHAKMFNWQRFGTEIRTILKTVTNRS